MATEAEVTWDDERCKRSRLATLQEQMKRHDIGALVLGDGVHVRYLLGVDVPASRVFVPAEGQAVGYVRQRDIGYVRRHHDPVRLPLDEQDVPAGCEDLDRAGRLACGVASLMEQYGLKGEQLGVDTAAPALLIHLIRLGVNVVDAEGMFSQAMAIKNDDEIAMYRLICRQYERTIQAFREACVPGTTENELAGVVVTTWHASGGEDIAQLNVCSAENMNPWRRWPTERALRDGDFVGIDLHARGVHGLRGDVSRTFFVGDDPTAEQRALYREAYHYMQETNPIFRAGRSFSEIAEATPPVPVRYQQQQYSYHIAHGVGMGPSGYPHIDPHNEQTDSVLVPNQVLAVECHFGEPGSTLAVKLEEMVVVRDGPPEVLTANVAFEDRLLG